MHTSRFDIAIAGDSLAARMVAALLVKHGKRLLLLSAPRCQDHWLHSSLFVEKLLGILGGRACFALYAPFQVLSSRARVTIHPELPIAIELTREFGPAAPAIAALLARLERTGTLLEELLWEYGGLPAGGVSEAARWRWLCLRRKLSLAALATSLADELQSFPEPVNEWLRDLFQGLSLTPPEALTIADGALLWADACRPEGVNAAELRELLHKRYEQFHGVEADLDAVTALEQRQGQWEGELQGGRKFRASHLVLGDLSHAFAGRGFPLPPRLPASLQHFSTSALDARLSPLLASRVIAGGPLPMRMVVTAAAAGQTGQIATSAEADEESVRRQLEPVLPFARYTLDRHAPGRTHAGPAGATDSRPSLFRLPLRLDNHLWCADDTRLLPHLGIGGAALLAWTLARQLDPRLVASS